MAQKFAIRIFLILAGGFSHHYGLSPPRPPVPKDASTVYRGQHFETMVLIWAFLTRLIAISLAVSHTIVALAMRFPSPNSPAIMAAFCPYPSSTLGALGELSPSFILGAAFMILACMLRAWCFTTLGRLFTYLITVVPDHVLVTSGPYAYVRHPSYTGVVLMLASAAFTHLFSHGNYIRECGIMMTPWKWLVWYWVGCVLFSVVSLRNRGKVEDGLMRKTFGKEWLEYRNNVPYSFIPYVI
ncbi:hypothetical protein BD779DRAFT_1669303 [Infundibulicybe gibba]|nr:hypothetical protein BD779DRAFT_1669303 [Infundibulicybe gibba]